MDSPDDPTAKVFDIVYNAYINKEETKKEINFIKAQINRNKPVLDLGCGTGRHMIPLLKSGYKIIGIDNSKEMLKILRRKLKKINLKAKLINKDIHEVTKFKQKFGGIICFWNAFTQIAKTTKDATDVFSLLFNSLSKEGKLVIEVTNPTSFNLRENIFKSKVSRNGKTYETTYETIQVNDKTNRTKSREHILIKKNGRIIEDLMTHIYQKWWKKQELEQICKKAKFSKVQFYGSDFKHFKEPTGKLILVATK